MKVYLNGKFVNLPDFIIPGAAKSGTTSLYYYLKSHPQIYLPKIKELCFFSFMGRDKTPWNTPLPVRNLEEYISCFKDATDEQKIGEFETYYLYYYKETIANIKNVYKEKAKNLKIVIILRNPIERVLSQYLYAVQSFQENLPFEQAIRLETIKKRLEMGMPSPLDYIGYSMYYNQVKAYMDNFPQVKVLLYDDLVNNPKSFLEELLNFLEVDFYLPDNIENRYNVTKLPKNTFITYLFKIFLRLRLNEILKKIDLKIYNKIKTFALNKFTIIPNKKAILTEKSIIYLKNIFKEDILKLEKLLNKDLSHWLDSY